MAMARLLAHTCAKWGCCARHISVFGIFSFSKEYILKWLQIAEQSRVRQNRAEQSIDNVIAAPVLTHTPCAYMGRAIEF